MRYLGHITAALIAATLLAGVAVGEKPEGGQAAWRTDLFHRNGRVSVNLPPDGSLSRAWYEESMLSFRWPGSEGYEFLSGGGFYLRYRMEGDGGWSFAGPGSFSMIEPGSSGRRLFEGCQGGRRYPSGGCDDDEDGLVDEDPFDGVDNDGDGRVDEDFNAIGHNMVVTRAGIPGAGIFLTQESYVWSFGHVRDFVGFTTRINYSPESFGTAPAIAALAIAHVTDFDIGEPRDDERGVDDEFSLLRDDSAVDSGHAEKGAPLQAGAEGPAVFAASGGGSAKEAHAAVMILGISVTGPGGGNGPAWTTDSAGQWPEVEAFLADPGDFDERTLWEAAVPGHGEDIEKEKTRSQEGSVAGPRRRDLPPLGRQASGSVIAEGDMAVVNLFGELHDLEPGSCVRIDWTMVFGRSPERLAANADRARATYHGVIGEDGMWNRWIVPARKAARVEVPSRLAPVWVQGRRSPAVSIELPEGSAEDVEWLKVSGIREENFEQIQGRVLVTLPEGLIDSAEEVFIEGQLSDGTIFRSLVGSEEIEAFTGDGSTAPDKLPEDCLKAFPNPFAADLNINLNVEDSPLSVPGETSAISSVRIYDVKGRLVRTVLEEDYLNPGEYSMGWDGRDENGIRVQPGVYYCKLQIGDRSITKRVVLLR